ncbi:ATP/GTP-binding protein [Pseudomonadota bacterium]
MILEYGARNFYCFKEWVTISFKLNQQCPTEISEGLEYTKILGVKGANASGKTNALKAIAYLSDFCTNSFSKKPDDSTDVVSFFSNENPTEIYAEFKANNILYRYEVELDSNKILRETIYRTKKRESKVVERIGNKLTVCTNDFNKLNIIKLRDNASLISTANQYEISAIAEIYLFFRLILSNTFKYGLADTPDVYAISEFLHSAPEYLGFVKKLIMRYDENIIDIELFDREGEDGKTIYFPIFHHDIPESKRNSLIFAEESSGTKALFLQLARYKHILDCGGLLVLDEFDINLHSDILPDLLSLFADKQLNPKHAQLIFTTHNTSILNFLGKYRSYLVNKERGESYAYRLDEIPGDILRNDRNISHIYKSGKIGGIPKL